MLFQSDGNWDLDVDVSRDKLRFTVGGETDCMMAKLSVQQARVLLEIIIQFIIEQEGGNAESD